MDLSALRGRFRANPDTNLSDAPPEAGVPDSSVSSPPSAKGELWPREYATPADLSTPPVALPCFMYDVRGELVNCSFEQDRVDVVDERRTGKTIPKYNAASVFTGLPRRSLHRHELYIDLCGGEYTLVAALYLDVGKSPSEQQLFQVQERLMGVMLEEEDE